MKYLMFILLNSQIPYLSNGIHRIISECTGPSGEGEIAFFSSLETYQSFSLALITLYIALYLLGIPLYSKVASMFARMKTLRATELDIKKLLDKRDNLENEVNERKGKTGIKKFSVTYNNNFLRTINTRIVMPILIGISLLACVALLLDFLESATFAYSKINNVDGYFKENNAIDYYLYLIVYCNHLMVHLFGWHSAIAALAFGTLTFYFVPKAVSIFQSIPDILEQRKAQIYIRRHK